MGSLMTRASSQGSGLRQVSEPNGQVLQHSGIMGKDPGARNHAVFKGSESRPPNGLGIQESSHLESSVRAF